MKKTVMLFFASLISIGIFGQNVEYDLDNPANQNPKVAEKLELDRSVFRVLYRYSILEDTTKKTPKDYVLLLQIGKTITKCADYYSMQGDSLRRALREQGVDLNTRSQKVRAISQGSSPQAIYTNYPSSKITVTDIFGGSSYLYEEPIPDIKWKLIEGTQTVCGYVCKAAQCNLFGRNYTAWYAPEIALQNGPWKLSGLPGLILKAVDEKGQVSFECIALEKSSWVDPIYILKKDYIKSSKKQILKSYVEYKRNPIANLLSSGMIQGDIPEKAKKERVFVPIELSE